MVGLPAMAPLCVECLRPRGEAHGVTSKLMEGLSQENVRAPSPSDLLASATAYSGWCNARALLHVSRRGKSATVGAGGD